MCFARELCAAPKLACTEYNPTALLAPTAERGDWLAAPLQPGREHPAAVPPQQAMADRTGRRPWRRAVHDSRICTRAGVAGAAGVGCWPGCARRLFALLAEGATYLAICAYMFTLHWSLSCTCGQGHVHAHTYQSTCTSTYTCYQLHIEIGPVQAHSLLSASLSAQG